MIKLTKSLQALHSSNFEQLLCQEIAELGIAHLPLQQGLTSSSYALDDTLRVVLLKLEEGDSMLHVKAGLFYEGMIAGCSCADDPSPVDRLPEYREVEILIRMPTAEASISLLDND